MKRTTKIIFFLSLFVVGRMMFDLSGCVNDDQIIAPVVQEEELRLIQCDQNHSDQYESENL